MEIGGACRCRARAAGRCAAAADITLAFRNGTYSAILIG